MKEREIALYAVTDILSEKGYNNIVLRKELAKNSRLSVVQRSFVTELVNGTLRNLINIDYIIDQFSKTPVSKMKPLVLNTLRIAVYQIVFMDKIPDSAACNEAVALIKKKGFMQLSGFVNGVLRNIARYKGSIKYPDKDKTPVEYLSVRYSYPRWIIDYWLEELSFESVCEICSENLAPPRICACINKNRATGSYLKEVLAGDNIAVTDGALKGDSFYISKTKDISKSKAYNMGMFHIMDESSMLAVKIMDPQRGDTVIDVCAAPGGKSFYCGYLMGNKGSIISGDIYEHKIKLLNEGAKRLGLDIVKPVLRDAATFDKQYEAAADRVLVDAPCSGLGLVKKKPDIKYNKTYDDIISLSVLQKEILKASAACVKKGGVLLYSTCTISAKENEENVKWFIDNFDFETEDITEYLPDALKCDTAREGYIQILPGSFGTDGFFIAKFVRKS